MGFAEKTMDRGLDALVDMANASTSTGATKMLTCPVMGTQYWVWRREDWSNTLEPKAKHLPGVWHFVGQRLRGREL